MRVEIEYCDKCEKEIIGRTYIYTVSWEDKCFQHTTAIHLCQKCAEKFHKKMLHTKENIPNW